MIALLVGAAGRASSQAHTNCVGAGCGGGGGSFTITPDGGTMSAPANTSGQQATFFVTNGTASVKTVNFACQSTGQVTCTGVEFTSFTFDAGETFDFWVSFSTGAAGSGTLTLIGSGGASDQGDFTITVNAPPPPPTAPTVVLRNAHEQSFEKSLCLTSGAGEAAAWQCGDLLVSHATPSYATLGKERSLTLVYSSAIASPHPVATAYVTQLAGTPPTSVYAELKVDKGAGYVVVASATYGAWTSGTRQISLSFDASTMFTGWYPYTLEVRNQAASGSTATFASGHFLISHEPNNYPYWGHGWSLAGVERITGWTDNSMIWIGPDGSVKHYTLVPPNTWGLWVAPMGANRDTISWDGTNYVRKLKHGVVVKYDNHGQPVETINRAGHKTQFFWHPTNYTLDSIKVPPAGAPRTTYKLQYSGGMLDKIIDPAGRITDLTLNGSWQLTSITDPVTSLVTSFTYDGSDRMLTRTSARGFTTRYIYANGLRVTSVKQPYGSKTPADTATTTFAPWDERGLAVGGSGTAVDTAQVRTVIRGARYPTVADTAIFVVDSFGAPTRSTNSMGHVTTIVRGDAAVPALPTRMTYPNGRVVKLTWNTRGNLLTQTDSTDRGQATSTWEYNSPNTVDSPSKTLDPLSRSTWFWYDSLGLTDSIKDPRGHRTRFWKHPDGTGGAVKGVMDSVAERAVNTWWQSDSSDHVVDQVTRFTYDSMGNLRTTKSPTGVITTYTRDSVQRVKDVYTPDGLRTERVYDAMNRVTESRVYTTLQTNPFGINPLLNCDTNQVACVDSLKYWDALPSILPTRYYYSAAGLDSMLDPRNVKRSYAYDASGRAWKETDDYGLSRKTFYGAGGMADSTLSRSAITARYRYDQLGRLTSTSYPLRMGPLSTSVPGDSMFYSYDVMGNLTSATNRNGTITRAYYLDGLLKQKVTAVHGFTTTFGYLYSVANELVTTVRGQDSVFYRYNAGTGTLDSIAVWWASPASTRRVFAFTWDSLGRRHKITYPANGMTVTYRYDGTGQLRRVDSDHPGGSGTLGDAFDFKFRNSMVDPMGRVLAQKLTCANGSWPNGGNPCGGTSTANTYANAYNPLSQLVRQGFGGSIRDSMRYDASGNMIAQNRQSVAATKVFAIAAGHNRMTGATCTPSGCNPIAYTYTADGDREHDDPTPNDASDREYYYDGLGRMAGYQTFDPPTGSQINHHDSCGYDPDGNMARSCDNFASWLAYDGNNVANELTTTGDGWNFISGPGTDDPLIGYFRAASNTRILYWVTDGAGRQFAVADSNGGLVAADGYTDRQNYRFAGTTKSGSTFGASRLEPGAAGAGLSFFRNRAYDQATGRWTQEDPIGLAGGANMYQFNGNNPVMYTDPFGLCKPPERGNATQSEKCASDITGKWCPSGAKGSYPDCKSAKTGASSPGSCPNVSGQEWDVGQDAAQRTQQSGVEQGAVIDHGGQVRQATGAGWIHTDRSIGPAGGHWPTDAASFVHGHPSGGGISPDDISVANSTGIRIVSSGVSTNRYGSAERGGTPTTCDLPTRP